MKFSIIHTLLFLLVVNISTFSFINSNENKVEQQEDLSANPILGEIILFGGDFAPRGYAFCHGQILAINQNQALYSLLGTTYGGDGQTSFALPDLRSRIPVHEGRGSGLSNYLLGEKGGVETISLLESNLPAHSHLATGKILLGSNVNSELGNGKLTSSVSGNSNIFLEGEVSTYMNSKDVSTFTTSSTGDGIAFSNISPRLGLNYIISLQGIFPSRS